MEVRLLGPVGVWTSDGELEIGPAKRRAVLALLAMRVGSTVSADQIIDFVWDGTPPPRARRVVLVHLSRLRAVLTQAGLAVRTVPAGYVLDAPADRVDAFRFRAAVAAAGKPSAAPERSAALRNALELWRGDALSGIGDSDPRRSMAAGLERLRLTALEQRVAADLDAGRHEELGAELAELVARYPTHEPFATAAMLAAWRSGRRGDALAEYDGLRARLADELGIDPGPDAQALFARILRDDAIPPDAGPHSGRSQLPARVRIFEGRADRLAELDRLATDEARVPVVVISGMGGVGKTALAVQWAGSAAARFPDGQFYVDLRGFDGRQPLSALEALTRLLIAAGVPPERVPSEPDAAASTYRALLADRRAIVVLDNARSSAQVRELLPGGPHTFVVITSRNALTGLVARDDARAMPIHVLQRDGSVTLFDRLFAEAGLTADRDTVAELADLCGHLPLAIRILAANLGTGDATPAELVPVLRDGLRLATLEVCDDPASSLAVVFDHSYRILGDAERRLFRLLGAAPGSDHALDAVAAVIGESRAEANVLVRRLVAANLAIEVGTDRFGFHDLVREFAESYSRQEDSAEARAEGSDRLIAWYVGLGVAAHRTINPRLAPVVPTVPYAEDAYPFGADPLAAVAFLNNQMANIIAVVRHAADRGRDESAAQILSGLYHVLEQGIAVSASIDLGQEAVSLAVRTCDEVAERRARINLGAFYNNARRPADAIPHLQRGIELARAQGVASSEAAGHCNLGVAYKAINDRDRALAAFLAADALRPDAPNSAVLNNIGNAYSLRGDLELAGTYLQRALSVAQSTGIRSDESLSLLNLGDIDFIRGDYELALERLHAAYDLAREIGNSRLQLYADQALAKINKGMDRIEVSRLHLNRALDLARTTGDVHREQTILGDIDEIAVR